MYVPQITVNAGGRSQAVSVSGVSAQSAAFSGATALFICTQPCWVRWGTNPTALGTGVDQYIPANEYVRLSLVGDATAGSGTLAIITTGAAGTAYITPGA